MSYPVLPVVSYLDLSFSSVGEERACVPVIDCS